MAVATSLLHRSLKGAVGDFIFRNYNGRTVVSLRPVYKNETNTEKRRVARGRFRDATDYASHAMLDRAQKAYYMQKARQLKLPNAYTAAITDYLRKAKIRVIVSSSFSGKKLEPILIKLSKSVFKTGQKITAALCNREGKVLSQQVLYKIDAQKFFHFKLSDDFPDYNHLRITTEEPGDNEYVIMSETFLRSDRIG